MCDVKTVLENLEKHKRKLILLNDIYDDLFKPWIEVEVAQEINQPTASELPENDLSLLYKLQNVLVKASLAKEMSSKKTTHQKLQQKPQPKSTKSDCREVHTSVTDSSKSQKKFQPKSAKSNGREIHTSVTERTKPQQNSQPKSAKSDSREVHTSVTESSNHLSVPRRKFIPAHRTAPFKTEPERKVPVKKVVKKNPVEKVEEKQDNQNTMEYLGVALADLQTELKEREEQFQTRETMEIVKQPQQRIMMELESACHAGWIVAPELRRTCRTRAKGLTRLAKVQLQSIDIKRSQTGHNSPGTISGPARVLCDSWKLQNVTTLIDSVIRMSATLDLSACTSTQIGFLRACLSLAVSTLVATQQSPSLESSVSADRITSPVDIAMSDTQDIREWLVSKQPPPPIPDHERIVLEAAYFTNCPFVGALPTPLGQPIGIVVKNVPLSPFRLSSGPDNDPISPVTLVELTTRSLIVQHQLHRGWATLLGRWISAFQDAHAAGDNSAREYRYIHGLLTGLYPVVLDQLS